MSTDLDSLCWTLTLVLRQLLADCPEGVVARHTALFVAAFAVRKRSTKIRNRPHVVGSIRNQGGHIWERESIEKDVAEHLESRPKASGASIELTVLLSISWILVETLRFETFHVFIVFATSCKWFHSFSIFYFLSTRQQFDPAKVPYRRNEVLQINSNAKSKYLSHSVGFYHRRPPTVASLVAVLSSTSWRRLARHKRWCSEGQSCQ